MEWKKWNGMRMVTMYLIITALIFSHVHRDPRGSSGDASWGLGVVTPENMEEVGQSMF